MYIKLPKNIDWIIDCLIDSGYDAYVVGGCIRDSLIGRCPNDWDIATSALPENVEDIFIDLKVIKTGKRFGTVTVVVEGESVEITTFRSEGAYLDGRRPDYINFERTIEEDLKRRDFTINAMAYNKYAGLVDPYGGKDDLLNGVIRCVGDAEKRFADDALRILRAIRFKAQLGYNIDKKTFDEINSLGYKLNNISKERITDELFKIFLTPRPSLGLACLKEAKLFDYIAPKINSIIGLKMKDSDLYGDIFDHTLFIVDNVATNLETRLAAFFHDVGRPYYTDINRGTLENFHKYEDKGAAIALDIMKRWKVSNQIISTVNTIIKEYRHLENICLSNNTSRKDLKKFISRIGIPNIYNVISLAKADSMCHCSDYSLQNIYEIEKHIDDILSSGEIISSKDMDIDGHDIIKLGFCKGRLIGRILDDLYDIVLEDPGLNRKDILEKIALEKYADVKKV